jgi:hypothetical protein
MAARRAKEPASMTTDLPTMRHFIHYFPRRIVTRIPDNIGDSWFSEVRPLDGGFDRPTHHITRRTKGPALAIAPGDTIWILSQIHSPWGPLPAGLDARIDVKQVEIRQSSGTRRFIAANSSTWFPLADITGELHGIETLASNSPPTKLLAHSQKPWARVYSAYGFCLGCATGRME